MEDTEFENGKMILVGKAFDLIGGRLEKCWREEEKKLERKERGSFHFLHSETQKGKNKKRERKKTKEPNAGVLLNSKLEDRVTQSKISDLHICPSHSIPRSFHIFTPIFSNFFGFGLVAIGFWVYLVSMQLYSNSTLGYGLGSMVCFVDYGWCQMETMVNTAFAYVK
ncbi:hypothetical protein GmHk_16G045420 [Glycine max]|nr:hypothetical protein GmHk_16G045420 [Glycine max]KAH1204476.1 hypothetical protein GmHk_16G045420 [Glycine max]